MKNFLLFSCLVLLGVSLCAFAKGMQVEGGSESNPGAPDSEISAVLASPQESRDSPQREPSPATVVAVKSKNDSIIGLILSGGIIGHSIIVLSIVAVALMIEHVITIREKVLIPPGFADEIVKKLNAGQWGAAIRDCRENPSVLATVLSAGLNECDLGWNSVEKGVEDAVAEQAARLYRKTEYLNLIGNIAPMLGLLGTVVGMILAFRDLANVDGYHRAGDLAQGIYLALITTVEGLIVAIPSLGAYAIFNNRISLLIAETTYIADQVLRPVKKHLGGSQRTKNPFPSSPSTISKIPPVQK